MSELVNGGACVSVNAYKDKMYPYTPTAQSVPQSFRVRMRNEPFHSHSLNK